MWLIEIPNMLMVGASGRNVGKTEFACHFIRKFADQYDVIAIKVTTIHQRDGSCPRGGEGCGTCTSIDQDFVITRETCKTSQKDTSRLLAAGAKKVYWLRSLKETLSEALRELIKTIGDKRVIVCESNSLRCVVQPGLFVMVEDNGNASLKPSARDVIDYADMTVAFDGKKFLPGLDRIRFTGDRWEIKPVKEPMT